MQDKKKKDKPFYTSIGGQAVIEGVMMRSTQKTAIAVRLPDGTIDTELMGSAAKPRAKFWRLPIIRGSVNMIDMFRLGYAALMKSIDKSDMFDELTDSKDTAPACKTAAGTEDRTDTAGVADAVQTASPAFEEAACGMPASDSAAYVNGGQDTVQCVNGAQDASQCVNGAQDASQCVNGAPETANAPEAAANCGATACESAATSTADGGVAAAAGTNSEPQRTDAAGTSAAAMAESDIEKNTVSAEGGDAPMQGTGTPAALAGPSVKEPVRKAAKPANKDAKKADGGLMMTVVTSISFVFGILLAVGLFIFIPSLIGSFLQKTLHIGYGRALVEGLIRIVIFILYIAAVSHMKDIKRLFEYHGAEHKTIFCYEAGMELTPENARKFKRFHPRCGTSFILIVFVVSILIFTFVRLNNPLLMTLLRLALLPVTIGISYEIIKFAGKHDNLFTRIISAPGLWLQRLTTKEPDDSQLEVAIASLCAVKPEHPDVDRW